MRLAARLLRRVIATRRLRNDVGVWYHPEYTLEPLSRSARSALVDAQRAERVLGALVKGGVLRAGDVRSCEPASFRDLSLVHTASWLEESTRPEVLAHVFGLEPGEVPVDDILRAQRRAVGGTIAAARAVAEGAVNTAFTLGGGFHHAGPEHGAGFCVYNDVAVAIAVLRAEGFELPIAVVDLDYHQGDGTLLAFADDPTVLTWSVHGAVWCRVHAVADAGYLLPPGTADEAYMALLERELLPALETQAPGMIFYVAGNDVLAGDRLGGFALSLEGVLRRDQLVSSLARRLRAGMVVSLGGGYSDLAWRATVSYASWKISSITMTPRLKDGEEGLLQHYGRIARSLDPALLQGDGDDFGLTLDDVMGDLRGSGPQTKFLRFYSKQGIELALERYGLLDRVRDRSFEDLRLEVDASDPDRQIIRLWARAAREKDRREHLLVEVVLRVRQVTLQYFKVGSLPMLSMEWLLLQDPTSSFSLERPKLPGQSHPGLGLSREVLALLVQVARRLSLHGIVNRPGFYHVASVTAFGMRFLDPLVQGRFLAMREVLRDWDLAEATSVVDRGRLELLNGEVLKWQPEDFVLPVSERLKTWFDSESYESTARAERERLLEAGLRVK